MSSSRVPFLSDDHELQPVSAAAAVAAVSDKFPLGASGIPVVFSARITPNPDNWRAWLREQILTVNIANLLLLIAVLVVSANINATLDQQRASNLQAQTLLTEVLQAKIEAQGALDEVKAQYAFVNSINATTTTLTALLEQANSNVGIQHLKLVGHVVQSGWYGKTNVPGSGSSPAWGDSQVTITLPSTQSGVWLLFAAISMANTEPAISLCGCVVVNGDTTNCGDYQNMVCSYVQTGSDVAEVYAQMGPIVYNNCGIQTDQTIGAFYRTYSATGGAGSANIVATYLHPCP